MKNSKVLSGHIFAFIAYFIFGLNIVTTKDLSSSGVPPMVLFLFRSVGAGSLFWIISLFTPKEKVDKKDYIKIFLAAFLGFFCCQVSFLYGISHITPMDCSILTSLSPIYTMLIAAVAIKEPITWKKALGVLLSLIGFIFLIFNSVNTGKGGADTTPLGLALIVVNTLSFSLYLGIFKPVLTKYSVVTFMKWVFLFTTIMALPLSFSDMLKVDYTSLSTSTILEILFLVYCATFITYFLIPKAQHTLRPTLISMYTYLQPIVAIAISICAGMDYLNWQKVVAALGVFGGVFIVNSSRKKE